MSGPAVGGSIESIAFAGRIFPVASDAEATRKLGGFENDLQANGDGSVRLIKTRIPWALEGVQVEVSDTRADQEFLQAKSNAKDYFPIEITFVSGITYSGRGILTSDVQYGSQSTTATLSMGGPGEFEQQ